ncbi:MAG: hypothetical protein RLO81_19215 [Fulvivirga sp.]|uniref:hypothetical protein n=1 Tax=Fulvivirga sp. TaxID=1931237 RepID=UPI0032EDAEE6
MPNKLISNIEELVTLTGKEKELVKGSFEPRHLKKKEYLLYKGDISNHMRFI